MRARQTTSLLLTAASCLAGHLGWSQQAPIAPLAPVTSVVAPPASAVGVEIQPKQSAALASTAAIVKQNRPVMPEPVYLINRHYISNSNALGTISPQQIAKIDIYKQGQGPVHWRSLTASGIVNMMLKATPRVKLKAMSLAAIKRKLGLHGSVGFELNGAPIQDESLQIVTDAIAGLDVTQATPATADKTVVNIRLVPYKPKVYPPGTIMIRGLATQ